MRYHIMSIAILAALVACNSSPAPTAAPSNTSAPAPSPGGNGADDLGRKAARFAPTEIAADISALPDNERGALAHMVRAAQVMDALFLEQVWAGNEAVLFNLLRDDSRSGKERLHYFLINKGPWSRLDHNEPFVAGVPPKAPSGNYYPADASKEEVERWIQSLPPAEKTRATGFFTTIRRGTDGQLVAIPYSTEYQGELGIAAMHLREAAKLTTQPSL